MTGSTPFDPEGCGLVEVIVALTVLSVGLLATAGLVRAVSRQADHVRAEGDAALLAQQVLGEALSERAAAPVSREDTLRFGDRQYAVGITIEPVGPALEHIRIDVLQLGPPGFGTGGPEVRSFGTRRRAPLPRLLPPAPTIP